jgi:hypothetical protein
LGSQRPTGRNTADFIELEVRKRTAKLEERVQVLSAQKLSAEVAAASCKTEYTAEVLLSRPAPPFPPSRRSAQRYSAPPFVGGRAGPKLCVLRWC